MSSFKLSPSLVEKLKNTPKESQKIMILDLGTTSSRVKIYDHNSNIISSVKKATEVIVPCEKASEIEPVKLWENVKELFLSCLENAHLKASDITCMGITTQRESFLLWNKKTGEPVGNINTWQDRRAEDTCQELNDSIELRTYKFLCNKTAYWTQNKSTILSGSFNFHPNHTCVRLHHMFENKPEMRELFKKDVVCGTVDSWIVYNLTGGISHVSDYASSSLTGYFDPFDLNYHPKLMFLLELKENSFPTVIPTHGLLAETSDKVFDAKIPITCLIGDQQASTFGCGCIKEGMVKATLGTGIFMDLYMGDKIIPKMLGKCYPVIGWYSDKPTYIYETRSDFANNHILKYVIENKISSVKSFDEFIESDKENNEKGEIKKLLHETIFCFYDIWKSFIENVKEKHTVSSIKVDGGYSSCDYLIKGISAITNTKVFRMKDIESTSRGACFLARLGAGLSSSSEEFRSKFDETEIFEPSPTLQKELMAEYNKKT